MSYRAVLTKPGEVTLTTGLLGVKVPPELLDRGSTGMFTNLRLDEIERRILAIEASIHGKQA